MALIASVDICFLSRGRDFCSIDVFALCSLIGPLIVSSRSSLALISSSLKIGKEKIISDCTLHRNLSSTRA